MLNEKIAEDKRRADEAQELDEERILREKNKEWEELMKRKEEQDERLATLKNYQAKLNKQRAASQATIDG